MLILSIGNVLQKDDGLGVYASNKKNQSQVTVVYGFKILAHL
jgi:Ni,Fe-hydrogenase maturation factor